MKSRVKYPGTRIAIGALGVFLALAGPCVAADAQNMDPFQNTGVWKSFDRYKEEQKEKLFSHMTGDLSADAKAIADGDAADAQNTSDDNANDKNSSADNAAQPPDAKPDAKAAQTAQPVLAEPERPIAPPVMPGVTARFIVPVDTTDDDLKPVARVEHIEADPDLQLPKQNWVDAAQAAREQGDGDKPKKSAINVRLSILPSFRLPSPQKKTKLAAVTAPKPAPPPQTVSADPASCAAIDAYKKRELEAIQSDRRTLTALQAAIKELGLNKELGFIAGTDSKIDTSDNGAMSTPATP